MRRTLLEQVEHAHAHGKAVILSEPDACYAVEVMEFSAPREKVRELQQVLHGALVGFLAGLEKPPAGATHEHVTACVNIYPRPADPS